MLKIFVCRQDTAILIQLLVFIFCINSFHLSISNSVVALDTAVVLEIPVLELDTKNSKIILPILGEPNDNFVKNESKPKARIIAKGENPKNFIYKFKNKIISLEEISNAASGIGSISLIPNIDGVIRNVPVLYNIDNRINIT